MTSFIGGEFAGSSGGDTPGGPAGGDLSGTYPNPVVAQITGAGGVVQIGATITGNASTNSPLTFGLSNIVIPSDANLVLTAAQYVDPILRITSTPSLTATRNIVLPAVTGATYMVYNNTTGGQSLQFIASTGSGVTVAYGLKADIYFDGTNYVPSLTVIGGDLVATNNISQKVAQISGTGTNGISSSGGTNINILATETVFGSSGTAPIYSFSGTATTTSASAITIITYTPTLDSINDFSVSLVGFDISNDGYFYRGDLNFTVWKDGISSPVITPSSPGATNVRSNGTASTYTISVSISGNNIIIQVAGNTGTTSHWSIQGSAQVVT